MPQSSPSLPAGEGQNRRRGQSVTRPSTLGQIVPRIEPGSGRRACRAAEDEYLAAFAA
jgi:hypothetical protein